MSRKIEPTASGSFKVRFRLNKKQTSETFTTRKRAEEFARWLDALGPQGALDQLYAGEQSAHVPQPIAHIGDGMTKAEDFEHSPGGGCGFLEYHEPHDFWLEYRRVRVRCSGLAVPTTVVSS